MLRPAPQGEPGETSFSCYSEIPKRIPPPFGSVYAEEDLDALARNDFADYALFRRVWVNNTVPLAAWLQDVGNSITKSTLGWHTPQQKPSELIPAQMFYQFQVQVTGGLDVKYGLTAPLWPSVGVEALGSMQKTNMIQIYLNGIEAFNWYNAQFGNTINTEAKPLPKIEVTGSGRAGAKLCRPRASERSSRVAHDHNRAARIVTTLAVVPFSYGWWRRKKPMPTK